LNIDLYKGGFGRLLMFIYQFISFFFEAGTLLYYNMTHQGSLSYEGGTE